MLAGHRAEPDHRRYAHIAAFRADALSPQLPGLSAVVSEDTVRRAISAIEEEAGRGRMQKHLDASVWPVLSAQLILDVDVTGWPTATIKPLYGKQEGAVLG